MTTSAVIAGSLGGPVGAITGVGAYTIGRAVGGLISDKVLEVI
jgi:hypothetical protein